MTYKLRCALLVSALVFQPSTLSSVGNATSNVVPPATPIECNKVLVTRVAPSRLVYKLAGGTVIFFRGDLAVDADGAPKAYHPTNNRIALDFKANGYPWAIVRVGGRDYIQTSSDPAPGYYVSQTSLEDRTKREIDPTRYVDADEIPYIVLPPAAMRAGGVRLGDYAVVINKKNGKSSNAIFADIGPRTKLGEGSIALARALGVNKTPKFGGPSADLVYIVFPRSGDGKPKSLEEINSRGTELFSAWGGTEQVTACFP